MSSTLKFDLEGPFNWINNKRDEPGEYKGDIENLEPRTGNFLANVEISGPNSVNAAVKAAKDAFPAWSNMTGKKTE